MNSPRDVSRDINRETRRKRRNYEIGRFTPAEPEGLESRYKGVKSFR